MPEPNLAKLMGVLAECSDAARSGRLSDLEAGMARLEGAVADIDTGSLTERERRDLAGVAQTCVELLGASQRGIGSVLQRMKEINDAATSLGAYDAQGDRMDIGQNSGKFEQKV